VAGHEFLQFVLESLLACVQHIGFGKIDQRTAGLVISQARSPFDGPGHLKLASALAQQIFEQRVEAIRVPKTEQPLDVAGKK